MHMVMPLGTATWTNYMAHTHKQMVMSNESSFIDTIMIARQTMIFPLNIGYHLQNESP